jgi:hypothetical protein
MTSIQHRQDIVLFTANQTEFYIELNSTTARALENTLQEKIYLQQLDAQGYPTVYQLRYNSQNSEYYLLGPKKEIILGSNMLPVYSFVILKTDHGLELWLGSSNHYFVSNRAARVKAAGDIYFLDGKIIKITDQSGGYNIPTTDPQAQFKRTSARIAMQAMRLPMEKFQPFIIETDNQKSKEVLFSVKKHIEPYKKIENQETKEFTLPSRISIGSPLS